MKNSGKSLVTFQQAQRNNHAKGVERKFKIGSANVRNLNSWCQSHGGKARTYVNFREI